MHRGLWFEKLPRVSDGVQGLLAYTDGGCRGNPGIGGWGFVLVHLASGKTLERRGGEAHTTNNRMEIMAALELLRSLTRSGQKLEIRSDSRYLIDLATKWAPGWKARGWTRKGKAPLKNLDLIKPLDALLAKHQVRWTWVAGHSGEPGNDYVDQLANEAMDCVADGRDPAAERRLSDAPIPL